MDNYVRPAAFRLNSSFRQLQRILNPYKAENLVIKTGKEACKLN